MFNKEQLQRFSIRKLTVGAASVLIGVSLMTEMSNNKVYADVRTTNENSNFQVHDNSDGNTLNLSTDLKSKADEAGTADSEVTNNSNARNVEIKNIDDSKKDQQSGDAVAPKEKTANAIQKHEENVAKGTTVDSNDLQVTKAQADLAATKINGKASSVVSPQIKQIQAKYQISKNLPLEKQINPTDDNSDGKVVVKAEDPSNYPSEFNNLISEDKYIYSVLSLNNYGSRYPDSKLILSVNRNDSNDKNIYAYVIDNNGEIKTTATVGVDQNKNIDINGRGYQINNDGSSNIIIGGNKESTQNSSTVTSAPGHWVYDRWDDDYDYYPYKHAYPIKQGYGLGNTTSNDGSAIGEIVPVFTKNSVIKYYYLDNEKHLQEFKNLELPNVSVEGFTGQEFEIDDVGQYEKVIQGYHLTSAPKGNFKGTLSQFTDDKYYKKVYYDFGTNKVKYSVLYHQIYPDGTMEVWLVDGKGDALTETRKIAPNTSTEFSNYNCTVRNPYVTAVQHEVQFIYSPNAQTATITYIDDTEKKTLGSDKQDGKFNQVIAFKHDPAEVIKDLEGKGYVLVSNNFKPDSKYQANDNSNVFEVHLKHGTKKVSQENSASFTVHYIYKDGKQAKPDHEQTLSFTEDGIQDLVTKKITWTTADSQKFDDAITPVITGYTPDQDKVAGQTANFDTQDREITVTYSPDAQHMTITYIDDTTGKTLHTDNPNGVSDQDAKYTTSDTIKQYEEQHYKLVSDSTKGQDLIFDHDDKADQTYEVHFVHGKHAIDQTTSPKQTIHYVYADGLARQGKAADDNVQQLSFKRDGYNDEVTGIDHWNAWIPANSQYEAVDSPVIQGYTPDKLVVEKSTANPTDKDIEVTVTYSADKQAARVIYIDKTTNNTLVSKDLSGKSDEDSKYNTKDTIGQYKSQHYVLAGDETDGKNVVFDHDDQQDQTYYVYFVHDTQNVSRQDTVTSTIDYKFEDGKTAQPTVTQTKYFNENGVKDLVTGKITWDEAESQKFDDIATKSIVGYTPDKDNVTGQTVKFGDKDIEVTVTYHNNAQKASVTYIDDKTGKTLKVDNLNGVTNAKSGYTTKAAIDTYTGLGYILVSDDTNGNEVVFDNDDAVDQAFTVHLSHGTTTVTPDNPGHPGKPLDPDNPDGPKYPDGTEEYQVKRTGTQIIHYAGASDKTPADNKQTFIFTREITFDNVTGKIISKTPWNVQSYTFGKVDTPVIPGYHADKAVAGGETVTPDDLNKVITVTYAPDGGSGDNPGSNGGGDQGTTPTPEPTPDDQPDTKLPSDNNTDKDVEKDKQDKPEKVKKARKIIKTRITKQEHIGNAEKAEPLAEQEHNDQTVASPVKNEANEPQLPQTGEANTSVIGLLGMLVAGFAAILGFESSRSRKHKN